MNDRELLEAAAKAVGLTVVKVYDDGALRVINDGPQFRWDPLADDGDALRLAAKLRLTPLFGDLGVNVMHEGTLASHDGFEAYGADPYAATRRAIVRAAAAMVTR